ncbi:MAG: Asp-tRNA(Asn)/Glu-tRNA(Gln) amidotransferase subunit GatB [Oscillospiraceae bacterium]|nr:Asp-tRNA(Asn)/Glu-tRNA(Gln) amidotransferase subunit GatB [Oscillospiraceae bacterium]
MNYQPVMGLEIHCELLTNSKVFCTCKNEFGGGANTRVCPRCSGMPGTLPLLNKGAVRLAAKAGFATNCTVNNYSAFDRKNYFYPDLPKAYQITQFESPICTDGYIDVTGGKRIRINRIHIEEDAGKLVHDDYEGISMADYNRCGVPLIEIVTEPDFRTIEEVQDFVIQIGQRLNYAGVCDAKMEQGSLRVDVNISLMPYGSDEFGTRAEIKNLNSVKSIGRAIAYEIQRQSEILDKGGKVLQETRRYNENHDDTKAMRSKEEAHDYRYFPEPDIPPVLFTDEEIDIIRREMPELPNQRFERYTKQYKIPEEDAKLILAEKAFSDFYDEAVNITPEYKLISNLMLGEISHQINETGTGITEVKFSPADVAKVAELAAKGTISKGSAKDIIAILFAEGGEPEAIAKKNGFIMSNDTSGLDAIIDEVLTANADAVEKYKAGNAKLFGFIMGQAIKACGKGANPGLIKQTLSEKLK